jgi:integrase
VYGDKVDEKHNPLGGQLAKWILPALGALKVDDVRPVHIESLHAKVTKAGSPIRANRCVSTISKMMSLAIRWEWRTDPNPCKGAVERNAETTRRRYLKPPEIARLTEALVSLKSQSAANAIRLLLLTGARRMEVLSARWDQFDLGTGTWTKLSSDTKQDTYHQIPLSGPALQLLVDMQAKTKGPYLFPGRDGRDHMVEIKTSWNHVRKVAQFDEPTRLHDVRHTLASILVSGGRGLPVIGAMLGHSNPSTTNRYAHLYLDPLREAAEHVGAVVTQRPEAEVVPLRGRR